MVTVRKNISYQYLELEEDVRRRTHVFGSNDADCIVSYEELLGFVSPRPVGRAQWCISLHDDFVSSTLFEQLRLVQPRMTFNLGFNMNQSMHIIYTTLV